jgi:hypothetical protein
MTRNYGIFKSGRTHPMLLTYAETYNEAICKANTLCLSEHTSTTVADYYGKVVYTRSYPAVATYNRIMGRSIA